MQEQAAVVDTQPLGAGPDGRPLLPVLSSSSRARRTGVPRTLRLALGIGGAVLAVLFVAVLASLAVQTRKERRMRQRRRSSSGTSALSEVAKSSVTEHALQLGVTRSSETAEEARHRPLFVSVCCLTVTVSSTGVAGRAGSCLCRCPLHRRSRGQLGAARLLGL